MPDRLSMRSRRPPLLWVASSLLVGALLGGIGGWMAHRPSPLPKQFTVTGTVTTVSAEESSFGFDPAPGTPENFLSGGYDISDQTQGVALLRAGAHVHLTVISPDGFNQIVLRVTPSHLGG